MNAGAITEYYEKIQAREVNARKWIKLLYERIVTGLRDGLFLFDEEKAQKAIDFIQSFWT